MANNRDNSRNDARDRNVGLDSRVPKVISIPEITQVRGVDAASIPSIDGQSANAMNAKSAGEAAGSNVVSGGEVMTEAAAGKVASSASDANSYERMAAVARLASFSADHVAPRSAVPSMPASSARLVASQAPLNGSDVSSEVSKDGISAGEGDFLRYLASRVAPAPKPQAKVAQQDAAADGAVDAVAADPAVLAAKEANSSGVGVKREQIDDAQQGSECDVQQNADRDAQRENQPGESGKTPSSRPSVKDGKVRKPAASKTAGKRTRANEDAEASGDADGGEGSRKTKKSRVGKRKTLIVAAVVVGVLLAIALFVSWGRWWRFDDAQDFQGQWLSSGTSGTARVSIDSQYINLSSDVAYSYTLDEGAKTLTFDFGSNMHGQGRYWFSADRSTLVIIDGSGYSAASTFWEDVALWWRGVFAQITGGDQVLPESDNAIYLVRAGSSAAASSSTSSAASESSAASGSSAETDSAPASSSSESASSQASGATRDSVSASGGSSDGASQDASIESRDAADTTQEAEAAGAVLRENDGASAGSSSESASR
jgi:hypothetical protein